MIVLIGAHLHENYRHWSLSIVCYPEFMINTSGENQFVTHFSSHYSEVEKYTQSVSRTIIFSFDSLPKASDMNMTNLNIEAVLYLEANLRELKLCSKPILIDVEVGSLQFIPHIQFKIRIGSKANK